MWGWTPHRTRALASFWRRRGHHIAPRRGGAGARCLRVAGLQPRVLNIKDGTERSATDSATRSGLFGPCAGISGNQVIAGVSGDDLDITDTQAHDPVTARCSALYAVPRRRGTRPPRRGQRSRPQKVRRRHDVQPVSTLRTQTCCSSRPAMPPVTRTSTGKGRTSSRIIVAITRTGEDGVDTSHPTHDTTTGTPRRRR